MNFELFSQTVAHLESLVARFEKEPEDLMLRDAAPAAVGLTSLVRQSLRIPVRLYLRICFLPCTLYSW